MMLMLLVLVLVGLSDANISGTWQPTGACLCVDSRLGLNIRNTACGTKTGAVGNGQCFKYTGRSSWCSLGGTRYHFFQININGKAGWGAGEFLKRGSDSQCGSPPNNPAPPAGSQCRGVEIVSRSQWGARAPTRRETMRTPVGMVFVHHTAGSECSTVSSCSAVVQSIQKYHMDTPSLRYRDIGYSFLVGGDGRAYEGRGWSLVGAHTCGDRFNTVALGIAAIGNFEVNRPSSKIQTAIQNLIQCGIKEGYIKEQYEVFGHKDACSTACPGKFLYERIKSWPRFSTRKLQ